MPGETIDYNEIAAKAAAEIVASLGSSITSIAGRKIQDIAASLRLGFREYAKAEISRVGYVRTIINPQEKTPIDDLYVSVSFEHRRSINSDQDLMREIRSAGGVLISGTAGSGKSIFLKYATLQFLRAPSGFFPIHYELRSLNAIEDGVSFLDAVFADCSIMLSDINLEYFKSRVACGDFALILDGFDEINFDLRARYAREINAVVEANPGARVVVTSRPEEGVNLLHPFEVYEVLPFRMDQTVALLNNIDYEIEKKEAFVERVLGGLYDQHEEFLSNPLLSTMMLMTFSQVAEIPSKISTFYQQAFEVLFQKHDRTKGVYTRKSHSKLPIDEFERVFAHFCAATYVAEKFSLGDTEILEYLGGAISFEGVNCSPSNFLNDLLQSTCLMQRDGLFYTFVHRSFQEYFAAVFISRRTEAHMKKALDSIMRRGAYDAVFELILQINPDIFEKYWVLPWMNRIFEEVGSLDANREPSRIFKALYSFVFFTNSGGGFPHEKMPEVGLALSVLIELYVYSVREVTAIDEYDEEKEELELRERLLGNVNYMRALESVFDREELGRFVNEGEPLPSKEVSISDVSDDVFVAMGYVPWATEIVNFANSKRKEITDRVADKERSFEAIFGE